MDTLRFKVQGSSEEPYNVTFDKKGDIITALCDCPAGKNGMYCKHRFNILSGSDKNVIDGDISQIQEISSWFEGSNIEDAIKHLVKVDEKVKSEIKVVKKQLNEAKKDLARTMMGKPFKSE